MRHLLVTQRRIPLARLDEYEDAWDDLCRTAAALGCHAWLYRAAEREDRFLEFVEWKDATPASPGEDAGFVAAREVLDSNFGGGTAEQWVQA